MQVIGTGDLRVVLYAVKQIQDCVRDDAIDEALGHIDVAIHALRDLEAILRERT